MENNGIQILKPFSKYMEGDIISFDEFHADIIKRTRYVSIYEIGAMICIPWMAATSISVFSESLIGMVSLVFFGLYNFIGFRILNCSQNYYICANKLLNEQFIKWLDRDSQEKLVNVIKKTRRHAMLSFFIFVGTGVALIFYGIFN